MKQLINRFAGSFQLLFVVAVVGAAILFSVTLQPEKNGAFAKRAPAAVSVSVVAPDETSYRPTVSLNGVVETRTVTDVIPQVSGRVIDVSPTFRAGSRIAAGEVLFRIDPADYELAVERTLAEIEAARSELSLLEAQSTAEQQVWNQQFPNRQIPDLIAKVPQIAAAKARIHSAEAARAAAELSLSRTVVRSPANVRVLETRLDIGQVIGAGIVVGSVFSVDSLEIAVPVSADNLALIGDAIGKDVAIARHGSGGAPLAGTVVRQAAALDENTRLGTLYVATDAADSLVLGEFVDVDIAGTDEPQTYRLPAASLTSRDQVWVVNSGELQERQVDVLGNYGDEAVVKAFDIADGIVAIPPADVRNGLSVSVKKERGPLSGGGSAVGAQ